MITMIKLKDVTKYYYSDAAVTLGLSRINLEFKLGEFVAITGESGSGKSTLLNVISGMDTYEEGELYFGKQETSCFNEEDWENYRRNHISLIYQSYNLIDSYTALENIESVLLICEESLGKMTKKERRERALSVLDQVGLRKYANHKASHLSSGQKQRLGIARALAKDTDIIIADEPTGNLDIENGKAVMEILHKLSKDKLVIVVTHNYEQAEPYVTRKVRLYDGEVAENIEIRKPEEFNVEKETEDSAIVNKLAFDEHEPISFKDSFRMAMRFVTMNQKGQPHRTFFTFMFILIAALATMIFVGTLSGAGDDTQSKNVSRLTFYNVNDNRLIVRFSNGQLLTDEDYNKILNTKYVLEVDRFDGANDVNYFYKPNEDYQLTYRSVAMEQIEKRELKFLDDTQFVHSASCITEAELKEGRLPEKSNEIVLYSKDSSMLGKEIDFYFKDNVLWSSADYVGVKMTVVGLLKDESKQVYFADTLAQGFNVTYDNNYDTTLNIHRESTDKATGVVTTKDVTQTISATFILNDNLKDNEIRVSELVYKDLWIADGEKTNVVEQIMEDATISVRYNDGSSPLKINVKVVPDGSLSSPDIVEVGKDVFEQIFPNYTDTQYSVYIRDYAYTDKVIESLSDEGYDVLSVLRFSATSYNDEKLQERMLVLAISAGATIVIFFLGIFVLSGMLKMKKGDFFILRSLGLDNTVLKKTNYINIISLTLIADILVLTAVTIMALYNDAVNDIVKYMTPIYYIIVIVLNVGMACLAAYMFNRYLLKTFRITMLREE
ncbi:MAG: ABC transporter ATP-binding protein [Lachnospiraceae bacterium]|nr:ABC transporter ATP-binding protein [Lachnospiraceae bacterium]